MKTRFSYYFSGLIIGLILTGCGGKLVKETKTHSLEEEKNQAKLSGWKKSDKLVVWADDGSELAVVILNQNSSEADTTQGETSANPLRHKIVVQNPTSAAQRDITRWRDAQPGQVFYMKQAGYFVVESLLENGSQRFDQIALNGNEILIIETPDNQHQPCGVQLPAKPDKLSPPRVHHTIIPSPDGLQLAHIYSPECGKVTVEFLHANNLSMIDSQTMDIDEPMRATWHPENYLILTNYNNKKAWKVSPLTPPLPIMPPKCLYPTTTSSEIALDGRWAYFEEERLVIEEVGREKAFGCQ